MPGGCDWIFAYIGALSAEKLQNSKSVYCDFVSCLDFISKTFLEFRRNKYSM